MTPLFFDDIEAGQKFESSGRTVTEADIGAFAGLSGDFNPLHIDDQWVSEHTEYPGRIAHGLLVLAITSGLRVPSIDDWEILAYLEVERRFILPVLPGDRLHQTCEVTATRRSRSGPSRGIVSVQVEVLNQDGATVMAGSDKYLVAGRDSK